MNKGLELIEAHHLFALPSEQIDVLVHPQSIVHSLVEFCDGSLIAQLGSPDMRIPIAYCLAWPERMQGPAPRLDLARAATLTLRGAGPRPLPGLATRPACARGRGRRADRAERRERDGGRRVPRPPARISCGIVALVEATLEARCVPKLDSGAGKPRQTHYLLTIIQDCWPANSCPKLPQRHPRRSGPNGGTRRGIRTMSFDFLSSISTLGWGAAGFPVRFHPRGVLPRARPFPGRPLVWRAGTGLFDRIRPGTVRVQ